MLAYLRPAGPLPARRFIIYAHYRSGSFLLRQLLQGHPDVHCDEEVFLDFLGTRFARVLLPQRFLLAQARRWPERVYGCILREAQLERVAGHPGAFLAGLEGWSILYLRREDRVRQALSNLVARQRRQWHTEHPQRWRIHLDPDRLLEEVLRCERIAIAERRSLRGLAHLELSYEGDLLGANHQQTADRVLTYLGLNPVPVQARLVPTAPERWSEALENYAELAQRLAQAGFSLPS